MAKKETLDIAQIVKRIRAKEFAPVYFLMGEELYFTEVITQEILRCGLTEDEKDFNLTVFYGADSTIEQVITSARRYPVMAARQIVLLKEAQGIDHLEKLEHYLQAPLASTILVINYNGKSYDSRKKLMKLAQEKGVVYESKKLYDNQIPDYILKIVKSRGFEIEPDAVRLLADNIGTDLKRQLAELEKLFIREGGEENVIRLEDVKRKIGISKDFTNFDLVSAIARRDVYKVQVILKSFRQNPKLNPPVVTLSMVFNYFANLMLCYYAPNKTESGIMAELNIRYRHFVQDYMIGMKQYNAFKTMENISLIREYDAKLKGINSNADPNDNVRELIFKLMH